LMVDGDGCPVEGTRTNIFVLARGQIISPPGDHLAVKGTLWRWLRDALPELGYGFSEEPLTNGMIHNHGLLLGNSVMGLVCANVLDEHELPVTDAATALRGEVASCLGLNRCA